MNVYLSEDGAETLSALRLGPRLAVTEGPAPVQLLACVPSEECGCPEELWRIDGIEALIHFEADGSSEAFLFGGDWEMERAFDCRNMAELRASLFGWVAELGCERETTV